MSQEQDENLENPETEEQENQEGQEEQFKSTPEELTSFNKSSGGPAWFDRKKVMMVISMAFAGIVIGGIIFSTSSDRRSASGEDAEGGAAANVSRDFLNREYERSLRSRPPPEAEEQVLDFLEDDDRITFVDDSGLPIVVPVSLADRAPARAAPPPPAPPPQPPVQQGGGGGGAQPPDPNRSSLVPRIEGNLFSSGIQAPPAAPMQGAAQPAQAVATYSMPIQAAQNFEPSPGNALSGFFLEPNILWVGTIIPAVLETAINTDLPGQVMARVTQNVFDSQTGRNLLVPQGSLLIARYNNSISYAQQRVQIAWDILIRPDGYMLELQGMNAVDQRGMSGLPAEYNENWFEYLKAAGIITMFSLANSTMVEQTARYGSDEMAAGVVGSNAEFMRNMSGNIISRALDIQPTLIVNSGEMVNVMLNNNLYLPPIENFPVTQRYTIRP